ncbi:unnamed protein product [Protopolystoma xenopodis]|uniref:Uncharacterized protein n=1 Tax=Protopolystoma xenopodis TaxID=117903 RepID=A0A448WHJ8_9PLAT|nr:unnamed protein product [Protopolystoma xenopodis]
MVSTSTSESVSFLSQLSLDLCASILLASESKHVISSIGWSVGSCIDCLTLSPGNRDTDPPAEEEINKLEECCPEAESRLTGCSGNGGGNNDRNGVAWGLIILSADKMNGQV